MGLGRPCPRQARTMVPFFGQSPTATFSRDLVTLNRGCIEVPADSARCPLANEGPLERALTLVSRQEPCMWGATARRERKGDDASTCPPTHPPSQSTHPATMETTSRGSGRRHQPGRQAQRFKALFLTMRETTMTTSSQPPQPGPKGSPGAMGGQSGPNPTWRSRKAAWRR